MGVVAPDGDRCRDRDGPARHVSSARKTPSAETPGYGDDFPPRVLRDYALLADGERGILVGPQGDCVWMCAPAGTPTPCCRP